MEKKVFYIVREIEDNIREIYLYDDDNSFMALIERFGEFMTNDEHIQGWLDDNGYGDEKIIIEKIG